MKNQYRDWKTEYSKNEEYFIISFISETWKRNNIKVMLKQNVSTDYNTETLYKHSPDDQCCV